MSVVTHVEMVKGEIGLCQPERRLEEDVLYLAELSAWLPEGVEGLGRRAIPLEITVGAQLLIQHRYGDVRITVGLSLGDDGALVTTISGQRENGKGLMETISRLQASHYGDERITIDLLEGDVTIDGKHDDDDDGM